MAYKVFREIRITEQLELCDTAGNPTAILDIDIAVDSISKAFNKTYNDAIRAQQTIAKLGIDEDAEQDITPEEIAKREEAFKIYGEAVIALFNLLFGEDNTEKILEFYENRYSEMSNAIFPFIFKVVIPAIEKSNKEQREMLAENYRQAKKKGKKKAFKRK